jgi:hypothetical protein
MAYEIGDRIVVQTTFTNEAGVPTSPSTVVAECKSPTGTVTPLSPTEASPGVWRAILPTFTEKGVWRWYIAGTAGVIAADQGVVSVAPKLTA